MDPQEPHIIPENRELFDAHSVTLPEKSPKQAISEKISFRGNIANTSGIHSTDGTIFVPQQTETRRRMAMSNLSWNRVGFWAVLASCGWFTLGCDAPPDGTVEDPRSIEGDAYPTDDTTPEATWEDGDLDADPAAADPEDAAPPLPALDDIPDVSPEVPEPEVPELTPETPELETPELPELDELPELPELPEAEETLPDSGLDIEQELDNIENSETPLP
jgi:hypothetical protein